MNKRDRLDEILQTEQRRLIDNFLGTPAVDKLMGKVAPRSPVPGEEIARFVKKLDEQQARQAAAPIETVALLQRHDETLTQHGEVLRDMARILRSMAESVEAQRLAAADPKHEWRAKYNVWMLAASVLLAAGAIFATFAVAG